MLWLHGLGLATCSARGYADWGGEAEDYDAVECLTFCFMPIFPLGVVHVSTGLNEAVTETTETVQFPLRYHWKPVVLAFARRWLWGVFIIGILAFFTFTNGIRGRRNVQTLAFATTLIGISFGGHRLLDRTDERARNIRYLLGRHRFGSSDPVDWPRERFQLQPMSDELYGTESFADAVPRLLKSGEFSRAIWAARLCVVLEDHRSGETLTDAILVHPEVSESLQRVRKNPFQWYSAMVGAE
jgi:hypothetical protein